MRILNDLIDAYALIDKKEDNLVIAPKSGDGKTMICAITPNFYYLTSERIKEILRKFASNIKTKRDWSIKDFWGKLSNFK
jgi:hypothetical protein